MNRRKFTGIAEFKEVQYFRQWWLWALMIFSMVTVVLLFLVLGLKELQQGKPEMLKALVVVAGLPLLNILAFYYACLETRITDEGIYYRWRPFFRKFSFISWSQVEEASIRKYSFMKFGCSWQKGYGKVHNVDGDKGIQLRLTNGKMIFIGSQRIAAVETAISKFREITVKLK